MVVTHLGLTPYLEAWEFQKQAAEEVSMGADDHLIFVEHPPVMTLGAGFHPENLLHSVEEYEAQGISVVKTDRGGDVTFHGPGQLVAYPIFDVSRHGSDLHRWLRDLEEALIVCVGEFGLQGSRFKKHTGVWIEEKKIASIGVKFRRWVSIHGVALNCSTDMAAFDLIIPCGIAEYPMTSLTQELGRTVTPPEAAPALEKGFRQVFGG